MGFLEQLFEDSPKTHKKKIMYFFPKYRFMSILKHTLPLGLLLMVFILGSLSSCKPQRIDPIPSAGLDSCWWNIGTDRYVSYRTVVFGSQDGGVIMGAADPTGTSEFLMTFYLPYVPATGDYALNCDGQETSACFQVKKDGITYRPIPHTGLKLHADSLNRRALLRLNPSWLYNTVDENDSVVVTGVFMQP